MSEINLINTFLYIKVVKALSKIGYIVDHQTGIHFILKQNFETNRRLSRPNHQEHSIGTLRAIIRQAGLDRKAFFELLRMA